MLYLYEYTSNYFFSKRFEINRCCSPFWIFYLKKKWKSAHTHVPPPISYIYHIVYTIYIIQTYILTNGESDASFRCQLILETSEFNSRTGQFFLFFQKQTCPKHNNCREVLNSESKKVKQFETLLHQNRRFFILFYPNFYSYAPFSTSSEILFNIINSWILILISQNSFQSQNFRISTWLYFYIQWPGIVLLRLIPVTAYTIGLSFHNII